MSKVNKSITAPETWTRRAASLAPAWLVDPIKETLEVFRLEAGHWLLVGTYEGDAAVRAEPFDAISLNLRVLWDRGQERKPPTDS